MARPRTLLRLAALAAAAAVALAGCGAGAGSASGSTLKWGFSLPTSWDPVTSSTGNDINTISLVYASLTQLDEKATAIPGLARSWDYNADGTAVTFHLRPGLTFTDGTPLDADAVKQSLLRGKTQQNSLLKDQLATISDITTSGDLDVTLHLAAPDYQVPNLLAGKTGEIVSPAAFTKDAAAIPTAPVGAGPFKFESFVPESKAVLVKNPGYWNADAIKIDRLELTPTTDPATVIAAVQSGALDVSFIPGNQIPQAKAAGLEVDVIDSMQVNQVDVNSTLEPLTDRRVVDALKYAIDREQIIDVINGGVGDAVSQPFPKGYVAYDPSLDTAFAYDPAKARQMLADAGYAPGQLSLTVTVNALSQATAELVQQQLQAVGVNATIKVVPPGSSTWQQEVYLGRKAQFALDGTVGRESPVQNLMVVYGSQGLMNTSKVATPEFLAALDAVRRTPLDAPNYPQVLQAAVRAGVQMSPSFSLGTQPRVAVRSKKVSPLPHFLSQYRWEGVTVGSPS
ncbi:ABC-type transporter, periplasmic subunit [Pseudonocardia dioxanivorans CB1190]|uniref:ABC-type transporter, periplasmic subunit n=1 Tax=Pseudonocardia dioxanivorans (strain ATCC 55486 / DSM 44775 / JCM 13855 / CB1190) TaxID=675635 RepID=F4CMJ6_PSEUX|nr:ABC transporter substrate-binding protein [Pseudonocardia dioxanivorans]AEA23980.1 ABC-type transporter, periplasmic subunit [Pseudonocardia dioxanivorans CB1190]